MVACHLPADSNAIMSGRMLFEAAEGKCIKTLIVGTSRVLDFNIDLCALHTIAEGQMLTPH
jgi:hypothetical protein